MVSGFRVVNGRGALAPQTPWLLSTTFQENIIMDRDLDQDRYYQVCIISTAWTSVPSHVQQARATH